MRFFPRTSLALAMGCAVLSFSSTATESTTTRHADAHQHGEGELNFVIEGDQVYLELKSPGFDILGFESITTEAQHQQLKQAHRKLQSADLWIFTPAADCQLKEDVLTDADTHHDEHDENSEHHDQHNGHDDQGSQEHENVSHMDIAVSYTFQCGNISQLHSLGTRFFQQFPNSEELTIQGLIPGGQVFDHLKPAHPEVRF